nr:translation initiation factor IF-2-like [Aegilops tauschii subsp. strangulata]
MATTAAKILLMAAETSGRRSQATEETIRRPRVGKAGHARAKGFGENFQNSTHGGGAPLVIGPQGPSGSGVRATGASRNGRPPRPTGGNGDGVSRAPKRHGEWAAARRAGGGCSEHGRGRSGARPAGGLQRPGAWTRPERGHGGQREGTASRTARREQQSGTGGARARACVRGRGLARTRTWEGGGGAELTGPVGGKAAGVGEESGSTVTKRRQALEVGRRGGRGGGGWRCGRNGVCGKEVEEASASMVAKGAMPTMLASGAGALRWGGGAGEVVVGRGGDGGAPTASGAGRTAASCAAPISGSG